MADQPQPQHQPDQRDPSKFDDLKRASRIVTIAVGLVTFASRAPEAVEAVLKPFTG